MSDNINISTRPGTRLARIITSFCASITMLGAFAADFNKTHILNPRWPPHAKFHDGQTMLLGAFLSACALVYTWRRDETGSSLRTGILLASLYWFSNAGAILFPGTAWADPERAGEGLIFGFPGAAVIGFVELLLLALALLLTRSTRSKATERSLSEAQPQRFRGAHR